MKFPRNARLKRKSDFKRVFADPSVSRDRCFRILFRSNGLPLVRLGLAVSRKVCAKASGRNRIKRVVRESFREHQEALRSSGGIDVVVLPSAQAATICNQALSASLHEHWQKIAGRGEQQAQ